MTEQYDIIFLGDVWDSQCRRRQQMALGLSKCPEVGKALYVELPLTAVSLMRYWLGRADRDAMERWPRVLRNGIVQGYSDGLQIVTPIAPISIIQLGLLWQISHQLAALFIGFWVRHAIRESDSKKAVLFITLPIFWPGIVKMFGSSVLIYDCSEAYYRQGTCMYLPATFLRRIEKWDNTFTRKADIVLVNSQELLKDKKRVNPNTYLCINAINESVLEMFLDDNTTQDTALKNVLRPILGYVGHLTPLVDLELMESLANSHPEWSFVVIGDKGEPMFTEKLQHCKNIHFLGKRPFGDLPRLVKSFDVCLGLFKTTEGGNQTGTSLKLPLYLASGKPIVSTNAGGARLFGKGVYIAKHTGEFSNLIEIALRENDDELCQRRIRLARENTWEKRITEINKILQDKLNHKGMRSCS